jgi:predicted transcriptional regulator
MSQSLTLQLSDATFAALQQQAEAIGVEPAAVAAASLEHQFGVPLSPSTEAERQVARQRFERHFGAVDLGHPTGADNEAIDADLAREYADTHEND